MENRANEAEINVVPLDVTRRVAWTKEHIYDIPVNNQLSRWIKDALIQWYSNFRPEDDQKLFKLHDPLAAYLAYYPEQADWVSSGVAIVLNGDERARTILDDNSDPCNIAMEVKNAENISTTIYDAVFT